MHHLLVKEVLRLKQTRRVQENDLNNIRAENAKHPLAGRLRTSRYDREFLVQQRIQQRRLADIRLSDDRYVSGFM
jgi:hypothetical protein